MKQAIIGLVFGWLLTAAAADLEVDVQNHVRGPLSGRLVTVTPLSPLPRSYSTNLLSSEPLGRHSNTNGQTYFSNLVWAVYRIDIAGTPSTSFKVTVPDTNILLNAAALLGSTNQPSPLTSFYTRAQTDALLAGLPGGSGNGTMVAAGGGLKASTNGGNTLTTLMLDTNAALSLITNIPATSFLSNALPSITVGISAGDGSSYNWGTPGTVSGGIQEAINALHLSNNRSNDPGGGIIQLTAGTHYTAETVVTPNNTNPFSLTILGPGMNAGGIVLTSAAPKSVFKIGKANGYNTVTFRMTDMYMAAIGNATTNMLYFEGYGPADFSIFGGVGERFVERVYFGRWEMMTNNPSFGLSPGEHLTISTKNNLLAIDDVNNFGSMLHVRDCQFSFCLPIRLAEPRAEVTGCQFMNAGTTSTAIQNDWPTSSPLYMGACITMDEPPFLSNAGGEMRYFYNNFFIVSKLAYFAGPSYFTIPRYSYADHFESDGSGTEYLVATAGHKWTVVNPFIQEGTTDATALKRALYVTNTANYSTWATNPDTNNLVNYVDSRGKFASGKFMISDSGDASGGGSGLTNLNASELRIGTVPAARSWALTGAITTSAGSAATALGSFTSANLSGALSDETGSGAAVFGTSPTIVTPVIASFATATHSHQNAAGGGTLNGAAISGGSITDVPLQTGSDSPTAQTMIRTLSSSLKLILDNDTSPGWHFYGDVSTDGSFIGLGSSLTALNASQLTSGIVPAARSWALTGAITTSAGSAATALGAFTSANLSGALSDETGSGAAVFAAGPTLTTPTLGVANATTINKVTLTAPASGSTLTIADGKTLTVSRTMTLTSAGDNGVITLPNATATIPATSDNLSVFTATTSAQFLGVISDETGSSSGTPLVVFNQSPTIVTPTIASFASATHNHQNAAGGGTLDAGLAIGAGTLAAARGGAGTVNGIMKADGAGLVSAAASGTDYASPALAYVTIGNSSSLSAERALTGTANQITVTDGGVNGAVTLSTPQDIATTATPQFARLGLGVAADTTTLTRGVMANAIGIGAYGLDFSNSVTAVTGGGVGNQALSPFIHLGGNGWKTTATAGSQPVEFAIGVVPVQGAASPTALLIISNSINGAAFTQPMTLSSGGNLNALGTIAASSTLTGNPISSFSTVNAAAASGYLLGNSVKWVSGSGTPEGAITAPIGSLYSRTDGGAGTSLYVKESGAGNTGWVGK